MVIHSRKYICPCPVVKCYRLNHFHKKLYNLQILNLSVSLQTFQKYLSYKKDHSELLYYILRQLTMDQLAYMRGLHNHSQTTIEISERDLIERARQINISDLKPFYESRIFKLNNFSYDQKRKVIIHTLPEVPTES